jgi:hypothetical protein
MAGADVLHQLCEKGGRNLWCNPEPAVNERSSGVQDGFGLVKRGQASSLKELSNWDFVSPE